MLRLPSPPFCRVRVMAYRKKDIAGDVDPAAPWRDVPLHRPVTYRVTQYPAGTHIAGHKHQRHQLVYAISGLMVVRSEVGRWVVPSTRAIWMPAGMVHAVDCIAAVHMRSLYIDPSFAPQLPAEPFAVQVAPLLRELLQAATLIKGEHIEDSRDGRVVRLLLDELHRMDVLPLHLPSPTDPRLQRICQHIQKHPGDDATLQDWAQALEVDVKTIQRHFAHELGMTFGQWRQQARLLAALERLAVGDKVIDVALAMGYDSPSAFTSMFKRQLGQTPAAFFR
ncbi:transcriptional regulator [Stenotrophomonas maltophilia]|uniref:AraC family transcriptional regulator n=3 Tax=Lysobacteraceae TaxID=32033 RepID=B2FMY7_STRMK|nr:transcriptional regulator [Stenotrophomonas maltophilia]CAQ45508.1 putative AraC family transcriptional regulator [Stenotrophomonas maltophilia K279a]